MPRIFISYKRADRPFLKKLLSLLQIVRDNNIWHDEQIAGGESWWEKILHEIAECDVFIYLLSNDSLKSPYCLAEFAEAVRLNKIIIPVVCRLQTEIPKRFPKSVSDPQTLKAILRKNQWITLINSDGEIDTAAFTSLNETIRISKSEKTQSPQTPDPTPMPAVDDKTFLGKILSTQAWVSIVIIVAIIGIIIQILNAPSPIITTPLPTENILATQSPTMTPIPLYLFERDSSNPVSDIWKILRDDSRGNYEVGQNLVVYRADVINPANGSPSEIPIAMVRVINKTETQLFVQVILKHVNAQYQIRTGDRINGNLDSLNTNDLIPAFSKASGYFLSIDGEPVVYLAPGISLSVGTILKVLKPSIRDQQIIDYFITETQIEVTSLGQAGVLAQVRLLDGATQMPENGTLVILVNPPTPMVPTTLVPISTDTPIETPTTPTSTASLTPTPTNTPTLVPTTEVTSTPEPTSTPTLTSIPTLMTTNPTLEQRSFKNHYTDQTFEMVRLLDENIGKWFFIDLNPVTYAEYMECVNVPSQVLSQNNKCTRPDQIINGNSPAYTKPIVGITWEMATHYCNYRDADNRTRLPTYSEWNILYSTLSNTIDSQYREWLNDESNNDGNTIYMQLGLVPLNVSSSRWPKNESFSDITFRCVRY